MEEDADTVGFENVRVTDRRPIEARTKSVFCTFEDGAERNVPRSQVPDGFEFPGDDGGDQDVEFDLEVSLWMANKWAEEGQRAPGAAPAPARHHVGMDARRKPGGGR